MNNIYTNQELSDIFGMRLVGGIALFEPFELGWACPKNSKHKICWSEFRDHIWCYDCLLDYFTLLCPKQMNSFTTEDILKEETERMGAEMATWTLDKYRKLGSQSLIHQVSVSDESSDEKRDSLLLEKIEKVIE